MSQFVERLDRVQQQRKSLNRFFRMKIILFSLVAVGLLVGVGCGKSEATKAAEQAAAQQAAERHDARQKFKEAVAAIVVRTKGSTYGEFRQSRLDLETCFEANKSYLADIQSEFAELSPLMLASDVVWGRSIQFPLLTAELWVTDDIQAMVAIRPSFAGKAHFKEIKGDPEFVEHNYISWGLDMTQEKADALLGILSKSG